jgi:hypothetical protein
VDNYFCAGGSSNDDGIATHRGQSANIPADAEKVFSHTLV